MMPIDIVFNPEEVSKVCQIIKSMCERLTGPHGPLIMTMSPKSVVFRMANSEANLDKVIISFILTL